MASGTISRRGENKWQIRIELPRKDGQRQRESITVHGKKRDAQAELTRILHEINSGTYVAARADTLAEYLAMWLETYAAVKVDPRVLEDYRCVVARHINPTLGAVRLQDLDVDAIQALYAEKSKTLSASRVRLIHVILHQALERAVKSRRLNWNPADAADPPRVGKAETEILDAGQMHRLLEAAKETCALYPVIYLGVHTGARLGELCALRWQDIDFTLRKLTIRQSLRHSKATGLAFKPPKNRDPRVVQIDPDVVAELRRLKGEQAQRRLLLGQKWQDHDLVCPNWDGTPRNPDQASHTFHDFIRRTGLPPVKFHSLRHSHATLLLDAGVPLKTVSNRLGHKTVAITTETYAHALPGQDENAASAFGELIRRASSEG